MIYSILGLAYVFGRYYEPPVRHFYFLANKGEAFDVIDAHMKQNRAQQNVMVEMKQRFGSDHIKLHMNPDSTARHAAWEEFAAPHIPALGKPQSVIIFSAGSSNNSDAVKAWRVLKDEFEKSAPPVKFNPLVLPCFAQGEEVPAGFTPYSRNEFRLPLKTYSKGREYIAYAPPANSADAQFLYDAAKKVSGGLIHDHDMHLDELDMHAYRMQRDIERAFKIPQTYHASYTEIIPGTYMISMWTRHESTTIETAVIPKQAVAISKDDAEWLEKAQPDSKSKAVMWLLERNGKASLRSRIFGGPSFS